MAKEDVIDLSKIDMPGTAVENETRPAGKWLEFGKNNAKEFVQLLTDQKMSTVNYVVNSAKITSWGDARAISFPDQDGNEIEVYPNDWARGQLVNATMGDRSYFNKCVAQLPNQLADQNVNAWLTHKKDNQLLRVTGERLRAFLSSGYLIIDNYDVLSEVSIAVDSINKQREIDGQKKIQFDKGSMTDSHMYVEILDPEKEYDISKGQTFYGMVEIKNSDVGGGAFNIGGGFYQWACQNLHIKDTVARKVHRGEKMDEQVFGHELVMEQAKLWIKMVNAGITRIFGSDELFSTWAQEIRETREIEIPQPTKVLKTLADEYKITETEITAIADMLSSDDTINPGDRGTGFAMMSAMTRAAKQFGPDREREISRITGDTKRLMEVMVKV